MKEISCLQLSMQDLKIWTMSSSSKFCLSTNLIIHIQIKLKNGFKKKNHSHLGQGILLRRGHLNNLLLGDSSSIFFSPWTVFWSHEFIHIEFQHLTMYFCVFSSLRRQRQKDHKFKTNLLNWGLEVICTFSECIIS